MDAGRKICFNTRKGSSKSLTGSTLIIFSDEESSSPKDSTQTTFPIMDTRPGECGDYEDDLRFGIS